MQYTENYHFPIYEASDKPSAANWNNCFETIDETMGKGGHEILDNAGDTIEQKDKLQFKTPLTVGNQDDATVVNVDMNVDLSGIIPPVAVLPTRPEAYSTDEIEIGTWIDGRTIYRKVIKLNNIYVAGTTDTWVNTNIQANINDLDEIINGFLRQSKDSVWNGIVMHAVISVRGGTIWVAGQSATSMEFDEIILEYIKVVT